ncbi:Uma2 family endonuclease [Actinocorallia populi]|uniref:Uma2 family endonuclease n=1 Tax=Actinocorallia populi TaxID=2079200 RepID=UPI0013008D4D|nr:Uma2 family endonuclease [Actinocorallia populi]
MLRQPLASPVTAQGLRRSLALPRGRSMSLTEGRVRIDGGEDARALAARLAWELPDEVRVELYDEGIVIAGEPSPAHETAVRDLAEQLAPFALSRQWAVRRGPTVLMPRGPAYVRCDLAYARAGPAWPGEVLLGSDLALAVEVAADPDAADDRGLKRAFYATAGASCYLLVDLPLRQATLFDIPCDGDYQQRVTAPLGEPLQLPDGPVLKTPIPD